MMLFIEGTGVEERLREETAVLLAQLGAGQVEAAEAQRLLLALIAFARFTIDLSEINPAIIEAEAATGTAVELRGHLQAFLHHPALTPEMRSALEAALQRLPSTVPDMDGFKFTNWVTFAHGPTWRRVLAPLFGRDALRVLEVGSFEGRSTCWIGKNLLGGAGSSIVCVDTFDGDYEQRFDNNIAAAGLGSKVDKRKGKSSEVLTGLAAGEFDLVYLDAASAAQQQIVDGVLAWPLLKPTGFFVADDYGGPPGWEPGVTIATDAFLECYRSELEILHKGFQLIVRKKSVT